MNWQQFKSDLAVALVGMIAGGMFAVALFCDGCWHG